ncbi:shikimate kinase [Cellulomonas sp. NPDC089187]|uniref:shikimate kinase n=1 Tax=Cellulomonas sp. NPDC089187 TaxID=3154970 RepID=UPI00343D6641
MPTPTARSRQRGTPPPSPDRGPLVVLCGPMGSGKTAIGRALSRRWDVPLRDTDVDVEERAGTTIADIFLHQGEQAFRDLEHQIVAEALAEHRGVLALGGGAPVRTDTQQHLAEYAAQGGTVVFLDVSIEFAGPRVGLDDSRPLLMGDPRQRWLDIMRERREIYEGVATMRVLTDGVTPAEGAREVERRMRQVHQARQAATRHGGPHTR